LGDLVVLVLVEQIGVELEQYLEVVGELQQHQQVQRNIQEEVEGLVNQIILITVEAEVEAQGHQQTEITAQMGII
jgi:hypothetical protein